jgi:hypothetical protein
VGDTCDVGASVVGAGLVGRLIVTPDGKIAGEAIVDASIAGCCAGDVPEGGVARWPPGGTPTGLCKASWITGSSGSCTDWLNGSGARDAVFVGSAGLV